MQGCVFLTCSLLSFKLACWLTGSQLYLVNCKDKVNQLNKREIERERDREREREIERERKRERGRERHRQRQRDTDRQTDKDRDR